jgi:hypothetical protein
LVRTRVGGARSGQHDRGDLVGVQHLDVLPLAGGVAVAVADHQQPPVLDRDPLQAPGDLREVRVGDVVHDHADRAALRPGQRLGMGVGDVPEIIDGPQDARPQVLGDGLGAAVDDPRRGRGRNPGPLCHVRQGHRPVVSTHGRRLLPDPPLSVRHPVP